MKSHPNMNSLADPHQGHSKHKFCSCGGHNQRNSKKKKGHNSTQKRLQHRAGRKLKELMHGTD